MCRQVGKLAERVGILPAVGAPIFLQSAREPRQAAVGFGLSNIEAYVVEGIKSQGADRGIKCSPSTYGIGLIPVSSIAHWIARKLRGIELALIQVYRIEMRLSTTAKINAILIPPPAWTKM